MTEEELKAIIDMAEAGEEEDDASAYVKQLQAVTVSSLPEELRIYEISDRTDDNGVRCIDAAADVDGVGDVVLLLDASTLPQEDIHWFGLYTTLLGEMDTAQHSKEELALLTNRYLYGGEIRLSIGRDSEDDLVYPRLRASWIADDDDMETAYDLIYEILYETDFSDAETLQGLISQSRAALKSSITGNPYSEMLYRSIGADDALYRYYSYFNGIEFYSFLEEVEAAAQEDPAAVAAKLAEIADFFHNRTGAAAIYAGSEEGIAANTSLAAAFMAKLDARDNPRAEYAFDDVARSEALIVDSSVQYNGVVASFDTMGLDGFSGALNALASAISDAYLYPTLRDQYGAYSVFAGFLEDYGSYIISYRDPNITETFDAYDALPDFVAGMEMDQEELDGYILSAYVDYARSSGELSGALNAALDTLSHDAQERFLDDMRALKALTPEDLRGYAAAYQGMMENGTRFTAGGASAVNANEALYEAILNPFGSVDTSMVELEDVQEGSEYYEAVRFVFENMLLEPLEETRFGVDDLATWGDLAYALYALGIGTPTGGKDALDTLSSYDILPADADVNATLTGEDVDDALAAFSAAVGVPYTKGDYTGTPSRGALSYIIMEYTIPLMG